ncbi:oxidative stress-induced growth inhibitor 1 isoform X2 [Desmodus rotundus]|uniref:oxidative stress-induced growth inhibitor 1 isoform X2 n=1 Tax=Desmodus rotundus TaxID=9430 RepID=UPI0039E3E504
MPSTHFPCCRGSCWRPRGSPSWTRTWITCLKASKAGAKAPWPCSLMPSCAQTQTLGETWSPSSPGSSRRSEPSPTWSWVGTCLGEPGTGLRNSRATAGDIAHYYMDYVNKKGLGHHFVSGAVVTAVAWGMPEPSGTGAQDPSPLFQVSGFLTAEDRSPQPFSLCAHNVVLATGTSDSPARLGIPGETLPFVHYELSALELAIRAGTLTPASDPILIVGAGLSAADAVLYARHYNIPVIHAFRRPVDDPGLVFNQLPKMLYPEYHKVHQMMREQSILSPSPYEGYCSLPEHQLLLFKEDHQAAFQDPNGLQKVFGISLVLVLIGSHPNLSFLPGAGADLAVDPEQPLSAKRNPIDVDPFTYQSTQQQGLYAVGPLAGDNFVRFVQGGALAVASSLLRREARKPP